MAQLNDSVSVLRGVGPARCRQLEGLGIYTLYDLLSYFPRRYEDRTKITAIADLQPDEPACIEAIVASVPRTAHIRRGMDITRLTVADHSARLNISYFNQNYLSNTLHYGETYYFYGCINADSPTRQFTNPAVEALTAAPNLTRRIVPVYPLTAGLSGKVLNKLIADALDLCLPDIPELLPESLRSTYHLCSVQQAYRNIHQPQDMSTLEQARKRLIFEEFFIFAAALQLMRTARVTSTRTPFSRMDLTAFFSALPYTPTDAQMCAIRDICHDFTSGTPMNRLLQGDVGSGKTLVAAAAACLAVQNNQQVAFMAPTEILAEQHYRSLHALLEPLGIRTVLLTGSMPPNEKAATRTAIASGEAQLIIGTHALIASSTHFSNLGLVIADEQHRFGVAQRGALAEKGQNPHLLFLSATPIPRTMTLLLYGDLNVSILDTLPPGRQKIETYLVGESMRTRINNFIRRQVEDGHQVYIICPAIEEDETGSLKSAVLWAETLQHTVFPKYRVALLHGKMKGTEKDAVMRAFSAGASDILVATTVVEVGVDVPNATLIVIENAERFGLSQLHQLRGRVGRGSAQSYCVLFSSSHNEQTRARLKALCETTDGFKIAEQDLALRGPGDFFGSRQHGLPAFKVANLSLDLPTLQLAQQAAEELLQQLQQTPESDHPLLQRIRLLFHDDFPVLN